MDIFKTLGSGSLSATAMLDFSGKANTSIHGLVEDDTASMELVLHVGIISDTISHVSVTRYSYIAMTFVYIDDDITMRYI